MITPDPEYEEIDLEETGGKIPLTSKSGKPIRIPLTGPRRKKVPIGYSHRDDAPPPSRRKRKRPRMPPPPPMTVVEFSNKGNEKVDLTEEDQDELCSHLDQVYPIF